MNGMKQNRLSGNDNVATSFSFSCIRYGFYAVMLVLGLGLALRPTKGGLGLGLCGVGLGLDLGLCSLGSQSLAFLILALVLSPWL
jgi:hypothetical protein